VITVDKVVTLEEIILKKLDFNVSLVSPLTFLERFLRLLNVHDNDKIKQLAIEICLRSMTKIIFYDFKPSIIAGSALLLAINIYYNNHHDIMNINRFKYWTEEV
jgi:transcription initiation factor TFIIIB Brf1 subunit/transcription initiation factor TFIIB